MFVSRLSVKVGSDSGVIERHTDVQKGYRCERIIGCEFNSGVNVIENVIKFTSNYSLNYNLTRYIYLIKFWDNNLH